MHLTEFEIASFIDNKSSKKTRDKVLKHLNLCEDCYNSFAEVYEIINEAEAKLPVSVDIHYLNKANNLIANKTFGIRDLGKSRKSHFLKYAFAISVVTFVFSLTFFKNEFRKSTENYRTTKNTYELHLFMPEDLSKVNSDKIIFRWGAIQKTDYYLFKLYDSVGNTVWNKSTKNINLELPEKIQLSKHTNYLWQVTAFLENGEKISSNLHAFNYKE